MIGSRHTRIFPFAAVIVAAAVMYAAQFKLNEFYVGTYMDDANYIILAESMVQGQGYRQINDPAAPLETRYSPGYPAVLAPIVLLKRDNLDLLKPPSVIATVLAVWLTWRHYDRRKTGSAHTLLALVLLAFNPLIVGHSVAVMSEAVFLAMLLSATLAIDNAGHVTEEKLRNGPYSQPSLRRHAP